MATITSFVVSLLKLNNLIDSFLFHFVLSYLFFFFFSVAIIRGPSVNHCIVLSKTSCSLVATELLRNTVLKKWHCHFLYSVFELIAMWLPLFDQR